MVRELGQVGVVFKLKADWKRASRLHQGNGLKITSKAYGSWYIHVAVMEGNLEIAASGLHQKWSCKSVSETELCIG